MKWVVAIIVALRVTMAIADVKHLWTELIAFDNVAADHGVEAFLTRMPEKPSAVSFLVFDPDFVNSHDSSNLDAEIGDLHCSYFARPWNEERPRQQWTRRQVRALVAELKRHGVDSYLSFFDMAPGRESKMLKHFSAVRKPNTWFDAHPEVGYLLKDGRRVNDLNPLERLADGTLYEDYFLGKLLETLEAYGFKGYHACDGFGHPRYSLDELDYRHLFSSATNRVQLCHAVAERHAAFTAKCARKLHERGLKLYLNTTWTRDPLEALYRYGIDYRLEASTGMDGFYVEASATVLELEGWSYSSVSTLDRCRSELLLIAGTVDVPLLNLACIKDGMEQYNSLRDAPRRLEAEILALGSIQRRDRPAASGVMWCLADGIKPYEWRNLDTIRSLTRHPAVAEGVRLVVSREALDAELKAYCDTRHPSSYALLARLLKAGAVVNSAVTVKEALADHSFPILVLNPAHFFKHELTALRNRPAPMVEFGLRDGSCKFEEAPTTPMPTSWMRPLPTRGIAEAALMNAVGRINSLSPVAPSPNMKDLRVVSYVDTKGKRNVLAFNDRNTYLNSRIIVRAGVSSAKALTDVPSLPIMVKTLEDGNSELVVKLPPAGAAVIALEEAEVAP